MVVDRVVKRWNILLLIRCEYRCFESRYRPHAACLRCQLRSTLPYRILVPVREDTKALVHPQGANLEAAFHISLVGERAITVFGVVPGQRQVAKRMQVRLVNALPLRTELRLPISREFFVLRQDVLDGV